MKTILSLLGGAVALTEDAGVVSLSLDASLGGGAAAGILKGQASLQLDAESAVKLGEAVLNSHLPASIEPAAEMVEGIANAALKAIE